MARFTALVLPLLLAACGGPSLTPPDLGDIHNLAEAPTAIRRAGDAVVLICTDGECGTGSFISAEGLLLTNNHVVGIDNCALEGCHVEVGFDLQLGREPKKKSLFAVPQISSHSLDASIVQLWEDSSKTQKVSAPHFLSYEEVSPADLLNKTVHLVGHPVAALKKWAKGPVYESFRTWFKADISALPGNSGSPILNDEGAIVGIVHHAGYTPGVKRSHIVLSGTSSRAILELSKKVPPPKGLYYSVEANKTRSEVGEHESLYRNARRPGAFPGADQTVLEQLTERCDETLGQEDFLRESRFVEEMKWCHRAVKWIDCEGFSLKPSKGRVCPTDPGKWNDRLEKILEQVSEKDPLSVGKWLRVVSEFDRQTAAWDSKWPKTPKTRIQSYLDKNSPRLSLDLAVHLMDENSRSATYQSQSIFDYVRDYKTIPGYQNNLDAVIDLHGLFYTHQWIDYATLAQVYAEILHDEKASLPDRLRLEAMTYQMGILNY